jgi:hypothetical protein
MFGGAKTLMRVVVALLPGGLVMLAAFILGRVVRARMLQETTGAQGVRLVRAVASVRFRDVWAEAVRSATAH